MNMERKLTQEDVWGKWAPDHSTLISRGLIVAQGYSGGRKGYLEWKKKVQVSNVCPVWKDKLPYKSVTVICSEDQINDVLHWLSYVHGGPTTMEKKLPDGRWAFRSDYQCW